MHLSNCKLNFTLSANLHSLLLTLSWSATYNIIDSEDHLCCFGCRYKCLLFHSEAFCYTKVSHVVYLAFKHVDACVQVAVENFRAKVCNQLSSIVATVFTNNSWQLSKSSGKSLASDSLFTLHAFGQLVHCEGHSHL